MKNLSISMLFILIGSMVQAEAYTVLEINNLIGHESSNVNVKHLGTHILAEFHGCINLNDAVMLKDELIKAAQAAGATVLNAYTHQFSPQGISGLVLLQESHLSIHTWPEYGYAAVDIYTCGDHVNSQTAIDCLVAYFNPTHVRQLEIDRGFDIN